MSTSNIVSVRDIFSEERDGSLHKSNQLEYWWNMPGWTAIRSYHHAVNQDIVYAQADVVVSREQAEGPFVGRTTVGEPICISADEIVKGIEASTSQPLGGPGGIIYRLFRKGELWGPIHRPTIPDLPADRYRLTILIPLFEFLEVKGKWTFSNGQIVYRTERNEHDVWFDDAILEANPDRLALCKVQRQSWIWKTQSDNTDVRLYQYLMAKRIRKYRGEPEDDEMETDSESEDDQMEDVDDEEANLADDEDTDGSDESCDTIDDSHQPRRGSAECRRDLKPIYIFRNGQCMRY